ncbi:hypothetical protein D5018_19465 [Parashewanella curva]|uniref:PROP1-like PPR domain-containing protein n=1 Tax=Parashewanella curva TaxID=2338552 RepID=A0A3L8PRK7_9GAMM|nr:hypothetical protein [Parashewanella curva]RLV58016.1 hypothetical protein D5018_19465 [Parashewanella curva]
MATPRSSHYHLSRDYYFVLNTLNKNPHQASLYLKYRRSTFDNDELLYRAYNYLSSNERDSLYKFFNQLEVPQANLRMQRYNGQLHQGKPNTFFYFTSVNDVIKYWKEGIITIERAGIALNGLIKQCTTLSEFIRIIHDIKSDSLALATKWDIRLVHGLLHKAVDFKNCEASDFNGIFREIIGVKSNYEAKTCTLLLKLCKLNLNFSDAKALVLGDENSDSLMNQWGVKPDVGIYNAFITVCAKTGQFDSAWQLVCGDSPLMSQSSKLKADKLTCTNLLVACAETGHFKEAKTLVQGDKGIDSLMKQWNIKPDVGIYNAFITVCAKTGQFDSAWQLVCGDSPLMSQSSKLKADKLTCTNLLVACAETGHFKEAKALVLGDKDKGIDSLMKQWDIKPDVGIYNAFITVCAKTGEFNRAWQLVCSDAPMMSSDSKLKADQITCTSLLVACAETGHFKEAKALVLGCKGIPSLMAQWGLRPNEAIYSAFITVCAKTGEFDTAWHLVCDNAPMMALGPKLKTNQSTCTRLLFACAETGHFKEAKALVLGDESSDSLMQQWGLKPSVAIYSAFITVCAKTRKFDYAWQLVCGDTSRMPPNSEQAADLITCTNLLVACAETGHFKEAKALVLGDESSDSLMQQWGIKPDIGIYNAFITVCAKTGEFDRAWNLVCGNAPKLSPNSELAADLITCTNLLVVCAETRRFKEAKALVLGDESGDSLMAQWGLKPNVAIYSAFITVCAKTGEFDSAWQLVCGDAPMMTPNSELVANQIICTNLLFACAETGHFNEAKTLVLGEEGRDSLMKQWGIKPNESIYKAFIAVFAKAGEFDSVMDDLEKTMEECGVTVTPLMYSHRIALDKVNFNHKVEMGITKGFYSKNLGLENNCLDLHTNKICNYSAY